MKTYKIKLYSGGVIEYARIEINRRESSLNFVRENGSRKTYTDHDLFMCLAQIRQEFPEIKFLCKGAKLNVHPSRMSSQMSSGLVAYELKLGFSSEENDIVRIFDYDDENITNSIEKQRAFYKKWIDSLTTKL